LLASYHAERSAAAAENLKVTSATMDFLVPQTPERRARRTEVLDRAVTDSSARALIDSGKLAEPYWYTASPLTTPGAIRPPVPGVLCPDGPVRVAGRQARLRRLFGRSVVVLTQSPTVAAAVADLAASVTAAPVTAHALAELDQTGAVRQSINATAESVHIVRPDGHLAAVLPRFEPAAVADALARTLGRPVGPHDRERAPVS
jgi:hypothetical protein